MIKKKLFQLAARILFPDLANGMLAEGSFDPFKNSFTREEIEKCYMLENNGADTTIFCFAGGAVLYAGLPTFEFQKILKETGQICNLVFFRDIRRMGYHMAPDGQLNGLEFYENKVRELMNTLGSTYNVALGSSHGGSAAFYFASRCGMDRIVAFNPVIDWTKYVGLKALLLSVFNRRSLSGAGIFLRNFAMAIGAQTILKKIEKEFGREKIWDVLGEYRNNAERPPATVFYGSKYKLDLIQASLISDLPEAQMVALPYDDHNCGAYLKQRGELGSVIANEIRSLYAA
jgi:hypothetical protein